MTPSTPDLPVESIPVSSSLTRFDFYGDALDVVPREGVLWIVVRAVCDALVIDPDTQRVKLQKEPWATTGEIPAVAQDGKIRNVFVVDLESLPMWLSSIKAGKVRPELRPKLVRYQRECKRVLAEHFLGPKHDPAYVEQIGQALTEIRAMRGEVRDLVVRVEGNEAETRRAVAVAMQAHAKAAESDAKAEDALAEVTAEREAAEGFVAWARNRRFPTGQAGPAFSATVRQMIRDIATAEGCRLGVKPEKLWAGINTAARSIVHLSMGEEWAELPVEMMAEVMGYLRRRLRRARRDLNSGPSQLPLLRRRRRPSAA